MWRHRAQHRSTPVKREAVIAGLASEGLALRLGSAEASSSAICHLAFFFFTYKTADFNMYRTKQVSEGCSVSLSLNLNLNINHLLSVVTDSCGGPCSNTCCGRGDCSIGRNVSCSSNGSYSSSRNGGCNSNGGVLCARAADPGSLQRSAPLRTVFVLLCARASASAVGARTDHAHD